MIQKTGFYKASFMKNKKAVRDDTARTRYKTLLALFPNSDTINEAIFSMNSPKPIFIFCMRHEKGSKAINTNILV